MILIEPVEDQATCGDHRTEANPMSSSIARSELMTAVSELAESVAIETERTEQARRAWRAMTAARQADRRLAEQHRRIAELERLAVTDGLTGLLNRRGFEDALGRTLAAALRHNERGVLIYIDLDGFKPVNDRFGHAAGDAVLQRLAGLLSDGTRASDVAARLGGDEFAVLLTRTDWQAGLERAEAFAGQVNGASLDWQGETIPLRASFGFQTFGPGDHAAELLAKADEAMYRTKQLRAAAPGAG